MRNLAAALFRLENSQGPEPVREVLAALAEWLADPEQMELRRSFVIWLHEALSLIHIYTALSTNWVIWSRALLMRWGILTMGCGPERRGSRFG